MTARFRAPLTCCAWVPAAAPASAVVAAGCIQLAWKASSLGRAASSWWALPWPDDEDCQWLPPRCDTSACQLLPCSDCCCTGAAMLPPQLLRWACCAGLCSCCCLPLTFDEEGRGAQRAATVVCVAGCQGWGGRSTLAGCCTSKPRRSATKSWPRSPAAAALQSPRQPLHQLPLRQPGWPPPAWHQDPRFPGSHRRSGWRTAEGHKQAGMRHGGAAIRRCTTRWAGTPRARAELSTQPLQLGHTLGP